jgi:hypothetical protein
MEQVMSHCQGKSLGCWQGVLWAEVRYCKIAEIDQKLLFSKLLMTAQNNAKTRKTQRRHDVPHHRSYRYI